MLDDERWTTERLLRSRRLQFALRCALWESSGACVAHHSEMVHLGAPTPPPPFDRPTRRSSPVEARGLMPNWVGGETTPMAGMCASRPTLLLARIGV